MYISPGSCVLSPLLVMRMVSRRCCLRIPRGLLDLSLAIWSVSPLTSQPNAERAHSSFGIAIAVPWIGRLGRTSCLSACPRSEAHLLRSPEAQDWVRAAIRGTSMESGRAGTARQWCQQHASASGMLSYACYITSMLASAVANRAQRSSKCARSTQGQQWKGRRPPHPWSVNLPAHRVAPVVRTSCTQ